MAKFFTEEGLKKLKEELKYLKTTKTKEIAEMLKYAASFGDLKENAGYHEAKDRQSFLLGRIAELECIVNDAIIYEKKKTSDIQICSQIIISIDGKEEKMQVVAPGESNILENKISYESPLGKNLLGKKVGDEFKFKEMKIKILEVD